MKKIFVLGLIVLSIFLIVGCDRPYAEITDGKLIRQEDRTIVELSIEIENALTNYWELYPGIDSTLLDNKGNEYKVLQIKDGSNISGKITKSGTYFGTLVFPKIDMDVSFLRLRIDNVKHYTTSYNQIIGTNTSLEGNYAITYNFEIDKDTKTISQVEVEKDGKVEVVERETYNLKRVSVSITDENDRTYKMDGLR